ncbi:MAG: hypothetical protein PHT99_03820 [Methanoregula sp.]|nr:hypothetical protein [Methanoregula sp.]
MSEDIQAYDFLSDGQVEKVPMHPEDYVALLAWVRAKEGWERRR